MKKIHLLLQRKGSLTENPEPTEDRSHFSAPQYTITITNIIHIFVSSCLVLMFFTYLDTNPHKYTHARKQSNHK